MKQHRIQQKQGIIWRKIFTIVEDCSHHRRILLFKGGKRVVITPKSPLLEENFHIGQLIPCKQKA